MDSILKSFASFSLAGFLLFGCGGQPSSTIEEKRALPPGIDIALSGEVSFDEVEGNKKVWSLKCRQATYSTEAGVLDLKSVKADYYKNDKPVYNAVGKKGRYDMNGRILDIAGDVHVTTDDGYDLRTDSLRYSFREKIAATPSGVEIEGQGVHMSGVGLEVSVDGEVISIKKDVKVVIKPNLVRKSGEGGSK